MEQVITIPNAHVLFFYIVMSNIQQIVIEVHKNTVGGGSGVRKIDPNYLPTYQETSISNLNSELLSLN